MLTKIKEYACKQSTFIKTNPFFQTGGRAPGTPVLDQPLKFVLETLIEFQIYMQFKQLWVY